MKLLIDIFTIILPFLYFVTVTAYALAFLQQKPAAKKLKTPFLTVTLTIHFFYLLLRTIYFQHPPIVTVFEIFSLLAFSIATSYRVIEISTEIKNTGFFVLVLALIFPFVFKYKHDPKALESVQH